MELDEMVTGHMACTMEGGKVKGIRDLGIGNKEK
jgi:hypothetical protein